MGLFSWLVDLFKAAQKNAVLVPATPQQEDAVKVLPNRTGTFIVTDIYPRDLGPNPPYHVLPGLKFSSGKEIVGCIIKASEGLGWGAANEKWFKRGWAEIKKVGGDKYGADWFRGCYHFLRFSVDGAKQADYFCDLVDSAGGWGDGDLMPLLDIEEGGQGSWAPGPLEKCDKVTKKRLADEVTTCATAFVKRFKERTGLRIAIYGRGLFRDLEMKSCKFGADAVTNPAYTRIMPRMEQYGIPLDFITNWQLCGDGLVVANGFNGNIPGWGKTDYSVYVDGANVTTLESFRRRCLAKPL